MSNKGLFKVGDWTVEPVLDRIGKGGDYVSLRPLSMDLLVYLARKSDEVCGMDDLIVHVWHGDIVSSAPVYNCLKELRHALGDDPHHPTYIKTIPKRGYQLIAPVDFLEREPFSTADSPAIKMSGRDKMAWRTVAVSFLVVLAAYFIFNLVTERPVARPVPDLTARQTSVAVLPFVDMSGSGDQSYFSDGMTEAIINKLAHVPDLKVSGRTSSFAFREPKADVQTIGRTLGVTHLLEGSVRREGDRVRVTAELLKAEDGFHLWSQEFDRDVTDVFAIQDEISGNIARSLKLELAVNEPPVDPTAATAFYPDFTAYELYLQARELIRQQTMSSLMGALVKLEQALDLDPDFALSHVAMAETYLYLRYFSTFYKVNGAREARALAQPHLDRALSINPNLAEAYVVQGQLEPGPDSQDALKSEDAFRKAISLNPNLASAHMWLAIDLYNQLNPPAEYLPHAERAVEIEPLMIEYATTLVTWLRMIPHRRDDALAIIGNLKSLHPDHPSVNATEVALLLSEGRLSEVVPLAEKILVLDPGSLEARSTLNIAWFSLGETERALETQHGNRQWLWVLSPDREDTLMQMKEIELGNPATTGLYNHGISAYIYIMLREWQLAVDTLSVNTLDLETLRATYGAMLARPYSPAMSLAVAHKALGDNEKFEKCVEIEKEALDIRSDFQKIQNADFARTMARLHALEGRQYEAMLELERLITYGPLDPRDMIHPAFDEIRDLPRFRKLVELQHQRINTERQKLGLTPIPASDSS